MQGSQVSLSLDPKMASGDRMISGSRRIPVTLVTFSSESLLRHEDASKPLTSVAVVVSCTNTQIWVCVDAHIKLCERS